MKRLAIVTTHPIQYNAPLFKLLTERSQLTVKVFYTWGEEGVKQKLDPGFCKIIAWDIPLLEGYDYEFLINDAKEKGSHHFYGISNPDSIDRIISFQADALLIFGWSYAGHLRLMRHFKNKIPVCFRGDSTILDPIPWYRKIIRRLILRRVYGNVDLAFYVGRNNYNYFKYAGLADDQLVYAPHAVDNSRFSGQTEWCQHQAAAFREHLQIPAHELVILYAGKLQEKKDPGILLHAFVEGRLADIAHLVIVGNGALEASLKNDFGQAKNIHFLDFQNQSIMPSVYKMANLFVLPSLGPGESWGLAINEAMAAGLAVIASDRCGGAEDLILQGKNGFRMKPGNETNLIYLLTSMLKDNLSLKAMGEASAEHIKKFTFQRSAESIEKSIQALA